MSPDVILCDLFPLSNSQNKSALGVEAAAPCYNSNSLSLSLCVLTLTARTCTCTYAAVLGVLVPITTTSVPASLSQQAVTQINWPETFIVTDSQQLSRGVVCTVLQHDAQKPVSPVEPVSLQS